MNRKSQSRGKASYKKTSKSERRSHIRRQEKIKSVWMMVGGAFIIVAAIILISASNKPRIHPMVDGNAIGVLDAPIVIVEFSDFQCSACRDFFMQTEQELFKKYVENGTVRFIFRSFGDALDPASATMAQAAYCAEDQGKFWEMHDALFLSYDQPTSTNLKKLAKEIDLDTEVFNDCLDSEKYNERVMQDLEEARTYDVTGTPSFIINGTLAFSGNHPISSFDTYIEALLGITDPE